MNAIIVSIGDELISGQTVDTNSAYLSRQLARRGIATLEHWTIADDLEAISRALTRACRLASLVLVTGGLGPTADDLTRQALAAAMGAELCLDPKCLADLEEFFRSRGRTMVDANRVQALVPAGAEPLTNRVGTAPGLAARLGNAQVYVVPGVPHEMRWIFENVIAPRLPVGRGVILQHVVHTFGAGESDVGVKIEDLMRRGANPTVGTTVAAGLVSIRVVSRAPTESQAQQQADEVVGLIKSRLGELVVCENDATMASSVGDLLRRAHQTLATAESCTGGMIGEMLTSAPGSSEYYLGGVVAYSNQVKQDLLGVPPEMLEQHGAVSEQVAAAMAQNCLYRFGGDWAISVTGIAGPGGGSELKPVGLVYVGLAGRQAKARTFRHVFPGPREFVRMRAALAAMNCLRLQLLAAD